MAFMELEYDQLCSKGELNIKFQERNTKQNSYVVPVQPNYLESYRLPSFETGPIALGPVSSEGQHSPDTNKPLGLNLLPWSQLTTSRVTIKLHVQIQLLQQYQMC